MVPCPAYQSGQPAIVSVLQYAFVSSSSSSFVFVEMTKSRIIVYTNNRYFAQNKDIKSQIFMIRVLKVQIFFGLFFLVVHPLLWCSVNLAKYVIVYLVNNFFLLVFVFETPDAEKKQNIDMWRSMTNTGRTNSSRTYSSEFSFLEVSNKILKEKIMQKW